MIRASTFLVATCALFACQLNAQRSATNKLGYTGVRLVHDCKSAIVDYDSLSKPQIGADAEHCVGYTQGLTDTVIMWQVVAEKTPDAQAPLFCPTSKVTTEVIIRQVPIWAIEHPEDTKGTAIELLLSMLVARYPCGK